MNVFIIGGAGHIGRAVTARALNAGHRVTALSAPKRRRRNCHPVTCASLGQWKMYNQSRKTWKRPT